MNLKNQIATRLAAAIRFNVDSLYAGRIDDATFCESQRILRQAAAQEGVEDLLRDLLVKGGDSKPQPVISWSHRANLDSWQNDFASDFEEND